MSATLVTMPGTIKPDGSLELEGQLPLPAGRVMVTVQPVPNSAVLPRGLADLIDEISQSQQARGFQGRNAQEIEAGLQEGEAEYEQRMQILVRGQATLCSKE